MTSGIFGTRLMAGLTMLFNVLALNLVMIVVALPLITAPTAVCAASAALDQWRRDGEDRVVRQFIIEFRARWSVRTTLGTGVPVIAALLGLVEIHHFARETTLNGRVGLVLGGGALLITVAALGYVFQLATDEPGLPPVELWSTSARLAVRNLLVAGPLSAAPILGVAILAGRDPAVLLLGLPLFLLHALKLVARPGLRRSARLLPALTGSYRLLPGAGTSHGLLCRGPPACGVALEGHSGSASDLTWFISAKNVLERRSHRDTRASRPTPHSATSNMKDK
jgi:hypothetical protein